MESEKKINEEIVNLTTEIRKNYPELTNYLDELTVSIPDTGKFDLNTLKDYRNTLKAALLNYKKQHKK